MDRSIGGSGAGASIGALPLQPLLGKAQRRERCALRKATRRVPPRESEHLAVLAVTGSAAIEFRSREALGYGRSV